MLERIPAYNLFTVSDSTRPKVDRFNSQLMDIMQIPWNNVVRYLKLWIGNKNRLEKAIHLPSKTCPVRQDFPRNSRLRRYILLVDDEKDHDDDTPNEWTEDFGRHPRELYATESQSH